MAVVSSGDPFSRPCPSGEQPACWFIRWSRACPLGLAFTCLLAAVPGSLVAAPFSMVLLAGFLTQVGALQTAPILIAVVTAFLTMEGVKYLIANRQQARAVAGKRKPPPARPA